MRVSRGGAGSAGCRLRRAASEPVQASANSAAPKPSKVSGWAAEGKPSRVTVTA
jgi:hypothetical protein